jgi:aspartate/glutamate racemase
MTGIIRNPMRIRHLGAERIILGCTTWGVLVTATVPVAATLW